MCLYTPVIILGSTEYNVFLVLFNCNFFNLIMITCAHTSQRGRNDTIDVCLITLRLITYIYQERNKTLKNRLETLEKHIGCLQMEGTSHLKARLAGVSDTLFAHKHISLLAPTEVFAVEATAQHIPDKT